MRLLVVQIFFLLLAAIDAGEVGAVDIVDLNGNKLSVGDGRVTELVFVTTNEAARAEQFGDNTPDYCLGDSKYRMITVLEFASHHSAPTRALIAKLARRRADAIARKLQTRYDVLQIKRDARADVFIATDFDGTIAKQFSVSLGDHVFDAFVLDRMAKIVRHWSEVPARDALDAALHEAAAQ